MAEDLERRLLIIESTCLGRLTAEREHLLAPTRGKRHTGVKGSGARSGRHAGMQRHRADVMRQRGKERGNVLGVFRVQGFQWIALCLY